MLRLYWFLFYIHFLYIFFSSLSLIFFTNYYCPPPLPCCHLTSFTSLLTFVHLFVNFRLLLLLRSSPLVSSHRLIWPLGSPLLPHLSAALLTFPFLAPMSWPLSQGCHGDGLLPGAHPWRQPERGVWQLCPGLFPREEDSGRTRLPNR